MRYLPQLAVAALAGSVTVPALAGPPRYEVTIVGEGSPLAYRAVGYALSSNGQVTGTLNYASPLTPFRWDGQLTAIETPPGVDVVGLGINASGTVVGWLDSGGSRPYVSRAGEPAQLIAPFGSTRGTAMDINDDGWVVGTSVPPIGGAQAFRWRDDVSEALPAPAWAQAAGASIITQGGDIYGFAVDGDRIQTVMWTERGVTELPALDGWDWTMLSAATDGGLAIGNAMNESGALAPVVWEDGQIRVLPHDPATSTYVSGVNAAGDIVGSSHDSSGPKALLWSGGEVIDLQDTVPAGFDGRLAMVHDINDRGQILVSAWFDGFEADRTVVLTPVLCYADCDGSGSLDFFDFLCFQNEFAAGATFADCDESGELDFFDFLCFQNEFSAGCS